MDTVVHQHGILVRYSLRCRKPVQTAMDVSVVFLRTTGETVGMSGQGWLALPVKSCRNNGS